MIAMGGGEGPCLLCQMHLSSYGEVNSRHTINIHFPVLEHRSNHFFFVLGNQTSLMQIFNPWK